MDNKTLEQHITEIAELPPEDLALVMSCVTSKQLKKGEAILKQGEVCTCLYLVEKGYLRTYYNKDGVAINLSFALEGDFTSNLKSFKSKKPSMLIIEAGEESTVWVFSISGLSARFGERPQISRFVRRLAISLLLKSESHSNIFKIYTPTERYRHIEKNNPKLLQRISLSQMASYLGVTRETLSRIRAKTY